MNIENKETITLNEFRAWLAGLIYGKQGQLPNLDDWKHIKAMLDKVQPDQEIVPVAVPAPAPQPIAIPKTIPRSPCEPWNPLPQIPHPTWIGDPPTIPDIIWCSGTVEQDPNNEVQYFNLSTQDLDGAFASLFSGDTERG